MDPNFHTLITGSPSTIHINVSEYRRGNQQSKEHEDPDGIEFPMTSGLIQLSTDIAIDGLPENKLNHSSHYNDSL